MPYEITNADVAARAARDMRRLASTVIELTEEAARGTVHVGDAAKIEQDLIAYRQIAEGLAAYARAAYKEGIKKAEAAAAQAQAQAAEEAAKPAEEAEKPAA